jgi:hypothetical protein
MGAAIAEIVPGAIGLALVNPVPILAVIVMVVSPASRGTAWAFLAGWVLGLVAVFGLLLFVASPEAVVGTEHDPGVLASLAVLALGLWLLVLGIRRWQSRPEAGVEQPLPSWMKTLEQASPPMALGLGAMLSGLNPKNLAFTVAAVLTIAQEDLTVGQKLIPVTLFVVLASVGVAAPVIWTLLAQERATVRLTGWRDWLTANYALIMAIVLLLFGVILVSKGAGRLIG